MKPIINQEILDFLTDDPNVDASVTNLVSSIATSYSGELTQWCPQLDYALVYEYTVDEIDPFKLLPPAGTDLPIIDLTTFIEDHNAAADLADQLVRYAKGDREGTELAEALANYQLLTDLGESIATCSNPNELRAALEAFVEAYPMSDAMEAKLLALSGTYGDALTAALASFISEVGTGEGQEPQTVEELTQLVSEFGTTPVTALSYFCNVTGAVPASLWNVIKAGSALQYKVSNAIRSAIIKGVDAAVDYVKDVLTPEFIYLGSDKEPCYLPYPFAVSKMKLDGTSAVAIHLRKRTQISGSVAILGRGMAVLVRPDASDPDQYIVTYHALAGANTFRCGVGSNGYYDGCPVVVTGPTNARVYPGDWKRFNSPFGIARKPIQSVREGADAKVAFIGAMNDYNLLMTLGLVLCGRLSAATVGGFLTEVDESLLVDTDSAFWTDWYQELFYCDPTTGVVHLPIPVTGDQSFGRRLVTDQGVSGYTPISTADAAKGLAWAAFDAASSATSMYDVTVWNQTDTSADAATTLAALTLASGMVDFESYWQGVIPSQKGAFLAIATNWHVVSSSTMNKLCSRATLATSASQTQHLATVGLVAAGTAAVIGAVAIGAAKYVPKLYATLAPRLRTWKSRQVAADTRQTTQDLVKLIKG